MKSHHQFHLPGANFLILTPSECPLVEFICEIRRLLSFNPGILKAIDRDLDHNGLKKKIIRQADKRWADKQAPLFHENDYSKMTAPLTLKQGRPRISARACYFFWMLCTYAGGTKTRKALDLLMDSKSVELFLQEEGCHCPSVSTILENVNAISEGTRGMIMDSQIGVAHEDDLDDFQRCQIDSTAVDANTAWPTDSSLMSKLLLRLHKRSLKLESFGLAPVVLPEMEDLIAELKQLDFKLNNTPKNKPGVLKDLYGQFLEQAEIGSQMFASALSDLGSQILTIVLKPSRKKRLEKRYEQMVSDLDSLCQVIECCTERIVEGVSRPSHEKVLSVSDPDAAFLKKGSREPRIGYKPQLSRSGKGLVTALLVPEGNAADAPQLSQLVMQSIERTGVVPIDFSADGGYASKANRKWLINQGVGRPSFSSSKGKAITPDEEWASPEFQGLRYWRSAVEALMSQIKGMMYFGAVKRRGLERVRAELTDKVLAFNFMRLSFLRS